MERPILILNDIRPKGKNKDKTYREKNLKGAVAEYKSALYNFANYSK